jgi:type II secretory pathway component PulC
MSFFHQLFLIFCFLGNGFFGLDATVCQLRDPFALAKRTKKTAKADTMSLEGLVIAGQERTAAILVYGSKREVVTCGQKFEGYTLVAINKNSVVLIKGKKKKTLMID